MKAMIGFTKGLMSMPMPWLVWLGLLLAVNVVGPIYFFEALEAKVVEGGLCPRLKGFAPVDYLLRAHVKPRAGDDRNDHGVNEHEFAVVTERDCPRSALARL